MGENQWRLTALGGSGENGRNCYLLDTDQGAVLLDCGVRRDVKGERVGKYPLLTEDIVSRIRFVLLSHCHEDHSAALPLLYALGFRGVIYASGETIAEVPRMVQKWIQYVKRQNGTLPYTQFHADMLRFAPLQPGENSIEGLRIVAGRSGHTVGSFWYAIGEACDGKHPLFYSGDMCLSSPFLGYDTPPACRLALLDCAYASRVLDASRQYERLLSHAQSTLARGGRLLLPTPPTGRGCDMLLYLCTHLRRTPVFAEGVIGIACRQTLQKRPWLRMDAPKANIRLRFRSVETQAQRDAACAQTTGIFLTPDGMLTTEEGQQYLRAFSGDENSLLLLTGHAAKGSPAFEISSEKYRMEHRIRLSVEELRIPVHMDGEDARQVLRQILAERAVLFHAPARACAELIQNLKEEGIKACCLSAGKQLKMG